MGADFCKILELGGMLLRDGEYRNVGVAFPFFVIL